MFKKFLNVLGFETKAQKEEFEQAKLAVLREARLEEAKRVHQARMVITTNDVPGKQVKHIPKKNKTTAQVRVETYGLSRDEDYLTPGFNTYYDPTVLMPAIVLPTLESYVPPASPTPDPDSDYGRHSAGSSNDSYSTSYDAPASDSYSYDPPASSSYDSGSSFDSGSW